MCGRQEFCHVAGSPQDIGPGKELVTDDLIYEMFQNVQLLAGQISVNHDAGAVLKHGP
jgi:hypothetical protein